MGPKSFAWYSKPPCNNFLTVSVFLLDSSSTDQSSVKTKESIPLKIELVYEDETPAPKFCFGTKMVQRNNPLLRFLNGQNFNVNIHGSCLLNFRVEEVIIHHHGHDGFKLKVSAENENVSIHPGILPETIAVLSKPNMKTMKFSGRGGRKSIWKETQNSLGKIPLEVIYDTFCVDNTCIFCGRKVNCHNFHLEHGHQSSCHFVMNIIPHMKFYRMHSLKRNKVIEEQFSKKTKVDEKELYPTSNERMEDFSEEHSIVSFLCGELQSSPC